MTMKGARAMSNEIVLCCMSLCDAWSEGTTLVWTPGLLRPSIARVGVRVTVLENMAVDVQKMCRYLSAVLSSS